MEKVTVVAFALGLFTLGGSFLPYHCQAPLLPYGMGICSGYNVPIIGGSPLSALTSIGLLFCAMEMANKTLRQRAKELKDERRERS